jgi:ubiquinone/menaquinone biosynthesis C-methylase UbiE
MRTTASSGKLATKSREEINASGSVSLEIELKCPRCGGAVQHQTCSDCAFHIRTVQGILHALPPERVAYYARFVEEYERICREQSSPPRSDKYYLDLPYRSSGSSADWASRGRSFDCLLWRVLKPALPRNARILDIGAGNCWLSYRLALAGYNPCAVDLLMNDQHGLKAAEHYQNYLPEFFPRIRADMGQLPFRDGQFHAAIFNASIQYADDVEVALREALRCCMASGLVIISDTPIHPSAKNTRRSTTGPPAPFLTDESINKLGLRLKICWTVHSAQFGSKWTLRRMYAMLRNRPEPPEFPIYAARKVPQGTGSGICKGMTIR